MTAITTEPPIEFRAGQIFGRSWQVFLQNFWRFFWITALVRLPIAAIVAAIAISGMPLNGHTVSHSVASSGGSMGWFNNIATVIDYLISMTVTGLLQYLSFQTIRGQYMTVGVALRNVIGRLVPVILLSIVTAILVGLGLVVFLIPGIIVYLGLSVGIPVCLIEGRGVFESLSRSWTLTKGHRWTIFLVWLIYFVVLIAGTIGIFIGFGIVGLILSFALAAIFGPVVPILTILAGFIVYFVLSVSATALLGPIIAVTYYYLRVMKDGVDINDIASVFD